MNGKTILALLSVLVIGITVPAYALEPSMPLFHETVFTITPEPRIGQTSEVILNVTHADHIPPLNVHMTLGSGGIHAHNFILYDIVSNFGTDDPTIFTPFEYDEDNVFLGEPGKTYTIKAQLDVKGEGYLGIGSRSIQGDFPFINYAVGKDKVMLGEDYLLNGETYLEHLIPVRGQSQSNNDPELVLTPNENTSYGNSTSRSFGPDENIMDDTDFWEGLAETYKRQNITSAQIIQHDIVGDLSRQEIIDFFRIYMEYNQEQLDALPIPISAYADTPLEQWNNGVPIEQIQCKEGKILMQSPNGRPACLSENSAEKLVDRDYTMVIVLDEMIPFDANDIDLTNTINLDSDVTLETTSKHVTNTPEQIAHIKEMMQSSGEPRLPPHYIYTPEFSKLPKVGETVKLTTTIRANDWIPDNDSLSLNFELFADPAYVRISNITSNIHSENLDIFTAYDHTIPTGLADPDLSYAIMADVEILREGFIGIGIKSFTPSIDIDSIMIVSSAENAMYQSKYFKTDQTWMDHTLPVVGQSAPVYHFNQPPPRTIELDGPVTYAEEGVDYDVVSEAEGWRLLFVELEEFYKSENYNTEKILRDLDNFDLTSQQIRDFFRIYMEYNQEQLDALPIPRDISHESGATG